MFGADVALAGVALAVTGVAASVCSLVWVVRADPGSRWFVFAGVLGGFGAVACIAGVLVARAAL